MNDVIDGHVKKINLYLKGISNALTLSLAEIRGQVSKGTILATDVQQFISQTREAMTATNKNLRDALNCIGKELAWSGKDEPKTEPAPAQQTAPTPSDVPYVPKTEAEVKSILASLDEGHRQGYSMICRFIALTNSLEMDPSFPKNMIASKLSGFAHAWAYSGYPEYNLGIKDLVSRLQEKGLVYQGWKSFANPIPGAPVFHDCLIGHHPIDIKEAKVIGHPLLTDANLMLVIKDCIRHAVIPEHVRQGEYPGKTIHSGTERTVTRIRHTFGMPTDRLAHERLSGLVEKGLIGVRAAGTNSMLIYIPGYFGDD